MAVIRKLRTEESPEKPEVVALTREAGSFKYAVPDIETEEQRDAVSALMAASHATIKKIKAYFDPDIERANGLAKSLREKRNALLAAPEAAKAACKQRIEDYQKRLREAIQANPSAAVSVGSATGAGVGIRTDWTAEITDIEALKKAWMNGKAPPDTFILNASPLNALARAMKDTMNIPGVKAVERDIAAVSRK